ncbi:MAG: spore protease YyaC [Muricoprocola sp.]
MFPTYSPVHYINSSSQKAPFLLAAQLLTLLKNESPNCLPPVFICIGTDRIIGDSLGPVIGSMLDHRPDFTLPVYGTLEQPIHALNLDDHLAQIYQKHPQAPFIAIDASLGSKKHQQYITISHCALSPGRAMSKTLSQVGDISITGIITQSGKNAFLALQNTRLSRVIALADCITAGICLACDNLG